MSMLKRTAKRTAMVLLLSLAAGFSSASMAAQDPTLHQVYQAAEAGKMDEAQSMMKQVLRDHPNSAKAHFVEAELLARQSRLTSAESELSTAERLAPGLPFATPQAVHNLKTRLSPGHASNGFAAAGLGAQGGSGNGLPWGTILIGIGVMSAIFFFIRSRNRSSVPFSAPGWGGSRYGASYPAQPYAPNNAYSPMGQVGGGLGSGIVGGLATGAALGAGMVAGEALMHHFTDGSRPSFNPVSPVDNTWNAAPDDMGGTDFGIADNAAWDDAGSDVVDDWGT